MDGYEEKRELFLRAVRYVHERGFPGGEAVLEAFGDMEAMDRLWLRPVPEFRGCYELDHERLGNAENGEPQGIGPTGESAFQGGFHPGS